VPKKGKKKELEELAKGEPPLEPTRSTKPAKKKD
jgi:hypothetical protein